MLHVHCVLLVLVAARVQHDRLITEPVLVQLAVLVDAGAAFLRDVHFVLLGPLVESFAAVLIIEQCAIGVNFHGQQFLNGLLFILVDRGGAQGHRVDAFIDVSLLPLYEGQVLRLVARIMRHRNLATITPRNERPVFRKIVLAFAPVPLGHDGD